MQLTSGSLPDDASPLLTDLRRMLLDDIAGALLMDHTPWKTLVQSVSQHFDSVGWKWNGLYRLEARDRLELHLAAGPPVCQTLYGDGEVGSSGMCFDALYRHQSLSTNEAHDWPGYVSCDHESGLSTSGALVIPLLKADGSAYWGVWDLDSESPLMSSDALFMERLIACLATLTPPPLQD